MIIAMPAGWTPSGPQVITADATNDRFNNELIQDIIPLVESHYRTRADPNIGRSAACRWVGSKPST